MLDHWSVHNWCQYCQRRGRSFGKIPRNIKEMKHSSAVHFLKLLKICISMSACCFSKVIHKGKDHDPSEVRLLNLYEKESFSTPLTYHLTPVSSNAQLNPEPVMMKSGWSHLDLQDSHPHKKGWCWMRTESECKLADVDAQWRLTARTWCLSLSWGTSAPQEPHRTIVITTNEWKERISTPSGWELMYYYHQGGVFVLF